MKFIVVFTLFCLALVSEEAVGELVKAKKVAWRWPSVTVSCPLGKKMLAGGGLCKNVGEQAWIFMPECRPISENQFKVTCDTPQNQYVKAEAYVICD